MLFKELRVRGFEVIPVNPNADTIEGVKSFASVNDIPGGINAAIAAVLPAAQDKVVEECAKAGIKMRWLHEHVMKGISNTKATYLCDAGRRPATTDTKTITKV
jgi:acyl-CoA synthetase (NDP forming)